MPQVVGIGTLAAWFLAPLVAGPRLRLPGVVGCVTGMVAAAFAAFVLYPGVLAIVEPAAASQNADSIAFVFVGAALAAQFIGLPLSLIAWAVAGRRRSEPTPADPNPITWPRPPVR